MLSHAGNHSSLFWGRAQLWSWGAWQIVQHGGLPSRIFSYLGGIGDEIMATVVLRELRRRGEKRLWMIADHPSVFARNRDCSCLLVSSDRNWRFVRRLGRPVVSLRSQIFHPGEDRDEPIGEGHLIASMCRLAGVNGSVRLRPYLHLSRAEGNFGRLAGNQIAVQSSGLSAKSPMANKEWFPQRLQEVVDTLRSDFHFVQIGSPSDPPLQGVYDLRGQTSLRETAAVLKNSALFLGLVGGLMHLARAVECRAVIIYGGRERPDQSGYICNENLTNAPACAPCWVRSRCDYDKRCMQLISAEDVVKAVRRAVDRAGSVLEVETVEIPRVSENVSSVR